MGFLDRYRQAPPSASGRMRHDMTLGLGGVALTGLWALSGAIRRMSAPPENDRTIALLVADRRVVAHDQDVMALTLVGEHLPRWHPGAHIDIHLPSRLVRQYSLCGDPGSPDTYRIAVRRIPDGGGGSIEMHDLRVAATVTTHGPRNAFPLTVPGYGSPARRFRFIAGGIGITPILPMLSLAQRLGVDWSMVYAGRSRDSLPFVEEMSRFGDRIAIRTDDVSGLPTAAELLGARSSAGTTSSCTSNGSPRRRSLTARSFRCRSPRPARLCGSAPSRRCFRRWAARECMRRTPASRVSAAPAAPKCSAEVSTTETPCSPIPNATTA